MRKEYVGRVEMHNIDSGKHPYTVIEVKMPLHLNYRIFVPGQEFGIGNQVRVILETKNHKERKSIEGKEKEANGNKRRETGTAPGFSG